MSRAEPADVVTITSTTTGDTVIQTFINVANSLINKALSNGCNVTDVTTLRQAEAFLAAHLLVVSGVDQDNAGKTVTEEKFEGYSVKFAIGQIQGDAIKGTTHGITANMLMDGCLSDLNNEQASVEFF